MIPRKISAADRKAYESWYDANKAELEAHFKKYGSSNWIKQEHRETLRGFLTGDSLKCAYCERDPNDGGGDLEIDHFKPKSEYKQFVFDLDNLLPACKNCNRAKSRDTNKDKIEMLNPFKLESLQDDLAMDPSDLKLRGISSLGKSTCEILARPLNTESYLDDSEATQCKLIKGALHTRRKKAEEFSRYLRFMRPDRATTGELFDDLGTILDFVNASKSMTATWATLICENEIIRQLIERLESQDPEKGARIKEKLETIRAYSLGG